MKRMVLFVLIASVASQTTVPSTDTVPSVTNTTAQPVEANSSSDDSVVPNNNSPTSVDSTFPVTAPPTDGNSAVSDSKGQVLQPKSLPGVLEEKINLEADKEKEEVKTQQKRGFLKPERAEKKHLIQQEKGLTMKLEKEKKEEKLVKTVEFEKKLEIKKPLEVNAKVPAAVPYPLVAGLGSGALLKKGFSEKSEFEMKTREFVGHEETPKYFEFQHMPENVHHHLYTTVPVHNAGMYLGHKFSLEHYHPNHHHKIESEIVDEISHLEHQLEELKKHKIAALTAEHKHQLQHELVMALKAEQRMKHKFHQDLELIHKQELEIEHKIKAIEKHEALLKQGLLDIRGHHLGGHMLHGHFMETGHLVGGKDGKLLTLLDAKVFDDKKIGHQVFPGLGVELQMAKSVLPKLEESKFDLGKGVFGGFELKASKEKKEIAKEETKKDIIATGVKQKFEKVIPVSETIAESAKVDSLLKPKFSDK